MQNFTMTYKELANKITTMDKIHHKKDSRPQFNSHRQQQLQTFEHHDPDIYTNVRRACLFHLHSSLISTCQDYYRNVSRACLSGFGEHIVRTTTEKHHFLYQHVNNYLLFVHSGNKLKGDGSDTASLLHPYIIILHSQLIPLIIEF